MKVKLRSEKYKLFLRSNSISMASQQFIPSLLPLELIHFIEPLN